MDIPNTKQIGAFMHCGACIGENLPQSVEVGWTPIGLQVWCRNHDCNIVHVDFQGSKHPANIARAAPPPSLKTH